MPFKEIFTVFGMILLVLPLLLSLFRSQNKYLALANGLTEVLCVQIGLALLLQAFHVFLYPWVLSGNLAYAAIRSYLIPQHAEGNPKVFRRPDGVLFLVLAICIGCLYQVHYKYTGKITDSHVNHYTQVKDLNYPYPYFADAWYAVAFIKYSIREHALPLRNPFYRKTPFINLEFVSHAFLSEVTVLLRLEPLTDYTKMSIGFNTLLIILIYLFLCFIGISSLTAGISALSALFITNGANLPGIWTLIPVTIGMLALILSLFYFEQKDMNMILLTTFLAVILYPPLFIILILAFLIFISNSKKEKTISRSRTVLNYTLVLLLSVMVLSLSFVLINHGLMPSFSYILSKIYYPSFENARPNFLIGAIIPWPVIALAFIALLKDKRTWLKAMVFTGLCYWFLYSFVHFRFIIEYERVIYISSLLIVILGGIGLDYCIVHLNSRYAGIRQYHLLNYFQIILLLFILYLSANYTCREQWRQLTFYFYEFKRDFSPAAPANKNLTMEDLRIFKNIHSKSFLSLPWKGTVLGVATDNYPRCTKSGTITINRDLYNDFINAGCQEKNQIAQSKYIKYIYSPEFNCPDFIYKERSSEGLALYEYRKDI